GVFFASTKGALEVVERYLRVRLRKQGVREGTFVAVREGEIVRKDRFEPDLDFVEAEKLPAVRAPGESEACLSALAALAAASLQPASGARGARPRPPPRAAARGSGTGTSPTRRASRRTSGRPATP